MSAIRTSTDLWPLFVTSIPDELSPEDLEDYIARVNSLYDRDQRFATLVETDAMTRMPGARERKRLADWQNETIHLIKRYNVCTAVVIRSPMIRGVMTAMHWIFRPPNEQVAVSSFHEGFLFCVERLRAENLPFSADLEHWARSGDSPPLGALLGGQIRHGDRSAVG